MFAGCFDNFLESAVMERVDPRVQDAFTYMVISTESEGDEGSLLSEP